METIEAKFQPEDLPRWARQHTSVVKLAEADLAFRCDVCSAHTRQMRKHLLGEAERAQSYRERREEAG